MRVETPEKLYLNVEIDISNEIDEKGNRPTPINRSFDVRVELESGRACPWTLSPCAFTLKFDGLRGGSASTRKVEGSVALPIPRGSAVDEYNLLITVDPSNVIVESDDADNVKRKTKRVKSS